MRCLQCGNVLFQHYFRECDESLIQLADQDGQPLTGQELVQSASSRQQAVHHRALSPTDRVVEVPITKVVRVPAEIRVVEKDVPVIQTVEQIVEKTVEVPVEVPEIMTRVIKVPQVVEVPIVREVTIPAAEPQPVAPSASDQPPTASMVPPLPEATETHVQTEWTMADEVMIIQDSDEEEFSYETTIGRAMSSAAKSSSS